MTIQSMTGFARSDGTLGNAQWYWEVKSVNGRGLDIRTRMPPGFDSLDPKVRESLAKRFSRGSITANLMLARSGAAADVRVNEAALAAVMRAADAIRAATGAPVATAEGLLALKGVLEVSEASASEAETSALHAALLASFEEAALRLLEARSAEGLRLSAVIAKQIDDVARLAAEIEGSPARAPEAIRARLNEQLVRLVESGQSLDPARLHQEAVMIATRADVEEELKRLKSHIVAARELIAEPGAVGRKLDFLAQEFFRECNTLTSKAGDADVARAGLALKIVVDQMREQVQNIE